MIASNLGLDGFPTPMIGVAALGLDGNGVSASAPLAEKICGGPAASARALATLAVETKRASPMFFPIRCIIINVLLWLRAGGVPLDTLSLTVTPPPLVEATLAAGFLDGFCVGAPWNELAQKGGAARLPFPCSALVRDCPEKVLAFTRENALREPGLAQAAARALRRAAIWGEHPENHRGILRAGRPDPGRAGRARNGRPGSGARQRPPCAAARRPRDGPILGSGALGASC